MSFFFSAIDGDVLWNYGFSYAISRGEIPYVNFNMIVLPFYSFIMAIPLLLSHNIIIYYLVNSLLLTIMFYYLFKMFSYKAYLLLILLIFPLPSVIFPTYNMFLLFLLIVIIYLEKNDKNDYLIGLLLGFSFLTKQTVGFFMLFPSLYYIKKDFKKVKKRLVAFSLCMIIFIIYLILSKSLYQFIDLCFLGMFDFSKSNGRVFNIFFFISIVMVIFIIRRIIKNRKDLINYYVLAFFTILLPLFDLNHFEFFLFAFSLLYLDKLKIKEKAIVLNTFIFIISYIIIFMGFVLHFKVTYPNHYHNFESRLLINSSGEFIIRDNLNNFIKKNKDKRIVILSSEAYFYKITNELDIDYFDLLNYGNHGYNGTKKLKKMIDKLDKDTLFIVSYDEYMKKDKYNRQQINKEVMEYIISRGKLVEEINCFRVYKLD